MPEIEFFKKIPDTFLAFLKFFKKQKIRKINLILIIFIFFLFPTQNFYAKLNIKAGRPVVRNVNFQLAEVGKYPKNTTGKQAPYLSARSALVVDIPSKTIMYAKNPDERLLPASTTKVMTALVALEYYQLDDVLQVETVNDIGMTIKLVHGEKMTVENLLYGMLVGSGNDAAYTLAENYPGGIDAFIDQMNKKAKELNLSGTFFKNVTGIENWGHMTTGHDLAILTAQALKNKTFAKIVSTYRVNISDIEGSNLHQLENINELLAKDIRIKGVKTGWTENAGECLVALAENENKQILTIVLGSQDRFGETETLVNWVFENFYWQEINEPSLQ